ncbi:6205_t:CDS:2 [Gigaspora rosea]|nr:6205_t:CDS:2 [Gigaspora rosea]
MPYENAEMDDTNDKIDSKLDTMTLMTKKMPQYSIRNGVILETHLQAKKQQRKLHQKSTTK